MMALLCGFICNFLVSHHSCNTNNLSLSRSQVSPLLCCCSINGKSLMKMLKSVGESTHPCFKPLKWLSGVLVHFHNAVYSTINVLYEF